MPTFPSGGECFDSGLKRSMLKRHFWSRAQRLKPIQLTSPRSVTRFILPASMEDYEKNVVIIEMGN